MSSLEDKFEQLGKAISSNASLLSELVSQGGEEVFFEKTPSTFNALTSNDVVLGNVSEGYSASILLMQLSHALGRSEVNRRLAPDVDEWLNRVQLRINQYHAAISKDNEDGRVRRLHEIRELVFEMREGLSNEVRSMQLALNTKFGHVESIEDKYIENRYLIDYLTRLTEKLAVLDLKTLNSIVGQNPDLRRLLSKRLHETIKDCRDDIMSAIPRLQHLMWQFEKKNQQASQIWALFNHFRTGSPSFDYEPSDDELEQLQVGCPTLDAQFTLYPDIYDPDNHYVLSDIISKLKPKKTDVIERKDQVEVSAFEGVAVSNTEVEVENELALHLVKMLKETQHNAVSCIDYWKRNLSHQLYPSGFMMLAHINFKQQSSLIVEEEFMPMSEFDATTRLIDFTVARAS